MTKTDKEFLPDVIWMQRAPCGFDTWCEDKIHDDDVAYTRAQPDNEQGSLSGRSSIDELPAVDVEGLYKGDRKRESDYSQGWNDCIDHLAQRGMIKQNNKEG